MKKIITTKNIVQTVLIGSLFATGQFALAHTRLQIPTVDEETRSYNNQVISHGCIDAEGNTVIDTLATVTVFPDGVDSSITVAGEASDKPLTDYVQNWGNPVRKIPSNDVFTLEDVIKDPSGTNTLGYWAGLGGLKAGMLGLIPFRINSVTIEPTSCAKTVKFIVAIADICEITDVSGFADSKVMLWTPAVGSIFDGTEALNGYNSPASFTVNRTSTIPAACGEGVDVVVTPSAAQLDRDMTIKIGGTQVWPNP